MIHISITNTFCVMKYRKSVHNILNEYLSSNVFFCLKHLSIPDWIYFLIVELSVISVERSKTNRTLSMIRYCKEELKI